MANHRNHTSQLTYTQRLELAAWRSLFWLVKSPTMIQLLPLSRLAKTSLVIVFLAACGVSLPHLAAWANQQIDSALDRPFTASSLATPPATHQRNTLLVIVNDLNKPGARLHGMWLALTSPHLAHTTILPIDIYREGKDGAAGLAAIFELTRKGEISSSTRMALTGRGIWWHNYVVIDQAGIAELGSLMGKVSLDGPVLIQQPGGDAVSRSSQAVVIKTFCSHSAGIFTAMQPAEVFSQLAHHINTNWEPGELAEPWGKLKDGNESLHCQVFDTPPSQY